MFKRDGTPRSRIKGLIIATLASGTLLTLYTALSLILELNYVNYVLSLLIYMQRVDADLSSVDLEDYPSTRAYFLLLVNPFTQDRPKELADAFEQAVHVIPRSLQDEAHQIMRDACEGVHEAIMESEGAEAYETAVTVLTKANDGLNSLAQLILEARGVGLLDIATLSKANEHVVKKPAGKGGDYEVVG